MKSREIRSESTRIDPESGTGGGSQPFGAPTARGEPSAEVRPFSEAGRRPFGRRPGLDARSLSAEMTARAGAEGRPRLRVARPTWRCAIPSTVTRRTLRSQELGNSGGGQQGGAVAVEHERGEQAHPVHLDERAEPYSGGLRGGVDLRAESGPRCGQEELESREVVRARSTVRPEVGVAFGVTTRTICSSNKWLAHEVTARHRVREDGEVRTCRTRAVARDPRTGPRSR